MAPSHDKEIGALTEAVATLKDAVGRLSDEVGSLKIIIAQMQGGGRVVVGISALIGALVSIGLIKIAPFIGISPK